MHIIDKTFLKLALLPQALYGRMGVNTVHLKAILTTKLTMDDRRPNTFHQTSRKKRDKPVQAATIGTMLASVVMGLVYLVSFAIGVNNTTHFTFYFSFFFFMLAASLISDFTGVLIDVRDNYILLPKPVSDRTIVTARILHIFIHICKLVVPMCLPGLVYVAWHYSISGTFYFVVLVLLLTVFVIFFINALYLVILRITTPARFQAIISYVQIGFAVALYASYQLLPRLADRFGTLRFDATAHRSFLLLPMYWFASGWNTLYTVYGSVGDWLLVVLCIIAPVLSLYLVVRYLAPSFNNRLTLLNSINIETQKPEVKNRTVQTTSTYVRLLAQWFTKQGAERMGFLFTWKMMGRSRDFKVKVYPSLGYLAVIVVMLFIRQGGSGANLSDPSRLKMALMSALYISSLLMITAVNQIAQSEKYKAAWLYFIVPLQKPGAIISGALKAVFLQFYLPIVVLIVAGGLYFIGLPALPNIALGICNQLLITTLIVYGNNRVFPFSLQQNNNTRTGTFLKNMLLLMMSAIIGLCHYLLFNIVGAILLLTILSALATWLLLGSIQNSRWQPFNKAYGTSTL